LSSVQPQLWKVFIELSNSPQKDKLFKMLDEAHQAMQPPPDPAIEMKGQELQARMQELQIKGEQDARKSQIDMAKAETDLQIANANLKLKELDIYQKQVEFEGNRALKVLDLQMRRQSEPQQEAFHG